MDIVITESQYKRLFEAMLPSFSLKELDGIWDYEDKFEYCCEHLGEPIGEGSSRAVFQIDDNRVLKLASDNVGVTQNDIEIDYYERFEHLGLFPMIYGNSEDSEWIISEYVLPLSKEDVWQLLGVEMSEFYSIIVSMEYYERGQTRYGQYYKVMERSTLNKYILKCPFFKALNEYIRESDCFIGDLISLDNLGLANRNQKPHIVILDSGLDNENYYNMYA